MNCMRLTEDGVLAAAGGLTRLTELSLRGCAAVTNAVAALLERLPALHSVDLRGCEHITGAAEACTLPSVEYPLCIGEAAHICWRVAAIVNSAA